MDKRMTLEEAIKQCKKFIKAFKKDDTKSVIGFDVQAIATVLQALENSIPKKKIEEKLKELESGEYLGFIEDIDLDEAIDILKELLEE